MSTEPDLQRRDIDGHAEYQLALDHLFAQPGQLLRIFDRTLSTDYSSPHRYDLLRAFLLARRSARIQIVVHDASGLVRDCPRMVNLIRDFSHLIEVHETLPEARHVSDPFATIDERHYVHRFHYDHPRGVSALHDPQEATNFVQRFAQIWEASAPAVSATTFGL
jgi:hypothetical protein